MAQDFIPTDITKNSGADFINLKEQLRHVADNLEWHRDQMDHNIDASDFTDVEAQWGFTVGDGEPVYNMLSTLIAQLAHADVQALFTRVGKT